MALQVLVTGMEWSGHSLSKSTNPSVSIFPVEINISGTTQLKTPQTCCKLSIYRPVTIFQQVATNLSILSSCNKLRLLKSDCCNLSFSNLLKQLVASLWITSFVNQLATGLLITCNRLVVDKQLQAMKTHPVIGSL